MTRGNYYNENDPFAAAWLEELVADGAIPAGWVDQRSIAEVEPADLSDFEQCHFFAGIAGWPLALRMAGWPDDRPVWTGSPPCQPYSVAGKKKGDADPRNLWPEFRRLIEARRPAVVFGEQSANASGWLVTLRDDLGALEYAVGAIPLQASLVGADHRRDRFYFVADTDRFDDGGRRSGYGEVRLGQPEEAGIRNGKGTGRSHFRSGQRVETELGTISTGLGMDIVAHGFPGSVALLRSAGNAIVPPLAAEFISGYVEARQHPYA